MQDVQQAEIHSTRNSWSDLRRQHGEAWQHSEHVAFPLVGSGTKQWIQVVQRDPTTLLRLVQQFPFPEELLVTLNEKVLEAWTADWRRKCLHERLAAYRGRTHDIATQTWLAQVPLWSF